jgi:hypothetical protein
MNAHHATPIDFTRLRRSLLRTVYRAARCVGVLKADLKWQRSPFVAYRKWRVSKNVMALSGADSAKALSGMSREQSLAPHQLCVYRGKPVRWP